MRTLFKDAFSKDYDITAVSDGQEALDAVDSDELPDIILLDIDMPRIDGFETMRRLKDDESTRDIPIIIFTGQFPDETEMAAFELGAVDFITKPYSLASIKARLRVHVELKSYRDHLDQMVAIRTQQLMRSQQEITVHLGRAAEYRDNETGKHIQRVSRFAGLLASAAGLPDNRAELIRLTSPLHDIGKIGIPDEILLKPGSLTNDELAVMRTHTDIGVKILSGGESEVLREAAVIAGTHHERWDGTGYPKGIAGPDIPIEGRIVAVCDVFDALTSERPYKKAWDVQDAVDLVQSEAGKQFDPNLARAFGSILDEVLAVRDDVGTD
jgi:putative two-component system response regulator